MALSFVPEFTIINCIAAIAIALIYIIVFSLIKEPHRQNLSAILVAGAGGVYWSGGMGVWEYAVGSAIITVAFFGLRHYYFIGTAWLMHSCWDLIHHLYGAPIVEFSPSSSAGCAVCDAIMAIWFFFKAPSVFSFFKKSFLANSQ